MRVVNRYLTSDNVEHDSVEKARKYCEEKAGEIILEYAKKFAHAYKYSQYIEILDEGLADLAKADRWRRESKSEVNTVDLEFGGS